MGGIQERNFFPKNDIYSTDVLYFFFFFSLATCLAIKFHFPKGRKRSQVLPFLKTEIYRNIACLWRSLLHFFNIIRGYHISFDKLFAKLNRRDHYLRSLCDTLPSQFNKYTFSGSMYLNRFENGKASMIKPSHAYFIRWKAKKKRRTREQETREMRGPDRYRVCVNWTVTQHGIENCHVN